MRRHEPSELLKLLHEREKELPKLPYRKPSYTREMVDRMLYSARCHADINTSDPWAFQRIMLYMQQGYELPSDVYKDYCSKRGILAKQVAQKKAFEPLERLKRKLDEDRAWNQYRAKQFKEEKAA